MEQDQLQAARVPLKHPARHDACKRRYVRIVLDMSMQAQRGGCCNGNAAAVLSLTCACLESCRTDLVVSVSLCFSNFKKLLLGKLKLSHNLLF